MKEFTTRVKTCKADSPSGQKVGESRQWHQPCSQQQFSAQSSTLLTFSSEGGPGQTQKGRGKSPTGERDREERSWKERQIARIFSPALAWFLPPPFLILSFMAACWTFSQAVLLCVCGLVFFFHFSVLEVASPLLKSCLKPLVHTRGSEWEGMCRVKLNDCLFRIVNPAPLYKANSAYLLCLSKKKKATPSYCYTHTTLCSAFSHTLLDWVCLCILALLTLPPPAMSHSTLLPPWTLEERWELNTQFVWWWFYGQPSCLWSEILHTEDN